MAIIGILTVLAVALPVSAAAQDRRGGMMGRGNNQEGERQPGIFGTVSSVSGNTLTVTSKRGMMNSNSATTTYTVDASSATVTKAGVASTVSAIAVGDTVSVQGTVNGTNVTAKTIRDGVNQPVVQGNGQPIVAGKVTAISGNIITITNQSNVTYTIDATNATITKGNEKSVISNVAVGDQVIAQGTINGNSVVASSVIDRGGVKAIETETEKPAGFMNGMMNRMMGGFKNFFHMFGF